MLVKNIFFLTALTFSGFAAAQHDEFDENDRRKPEEKAAALTEKMKKELNLSADQVAKIGPKNVAFFQKQQAHHEKMKALREEHKKHMNEHRDAVKADLTPEQQKKAEDLISDRKEKRKEKMKKRRQR
jgi:Spy/CpxP family protein refolding chaperone